MPHHRAAGKERNGTPLHHWTFRPLTPEDLPWLDRCRNAPAHPFTALSPVSLVTWAETYGLTVAGDEDFFVVHSRYDKGYYAPVGNPEKCAAFMEEVRAAGNPVRFNYVTEPDARLLAAGGGKMFFRADLSEYVISSAVLEGKPGSGVSESFRRKCRAFSRNFEGYRVTPVSAEHMERLRAVAEKYLDAQEHMPADQAVLEAELERFAALKLRGILLTMPDGREAFILGYENTPEMFTMTMTRHDPTLPPETTTVCIHEFAALLNGKYPLINVEEDMGMDGLRRAKMLLSPMDLLKAYEVIL